MGVILAFFIGFAFGSRAGREGMEQLIDAVFEIAQSDEVRGMVATGAALLGTPLQEVLLPNSNGTNSRTTTAGAIGDLATGLISSFNRRVA